MRIVSGRLRGRRLVYPRAGLRPTKEMTRQAIFNILGRRVTGARVLDLFAGGGSLGIEALSRGARSAVFVEKSAGAVRFLRENARGLAGARVVRGDVLRVLRRLKGEQFDLILADPPYCNGLVQPTIDLVVQYEILAPDGWFVVEHHRQEEPVGPAGWEVLGKGRFGESLVTVFHRSRTDGCNSRVCGNDRAE
ncbi:MAG: 16S rRNA (guanine(966)-N(2))-methyltransferase RsmD [candidate division WOR-3 bacterium]